MKVTIENYRGFEILFDTNHERFQCIITEDHTKESKSYPAVKKFIDEYMKDNQSFKPFYIESIPGSYNDRGTLKIVGIRKDKRFITEDKNGNKGQVSEYDLDKSMLKKECNQSIIESIKFLESKFKDYQKKYIEDKKHLIGKLDIVKLSDYKKTLIDN
jgi:hypothetical protein